MPAPNSPTDKKPSVSTRRHKPSKSLSFDDPKISRTDKINTASKRDGGMTQAALPHQRTRDVTMDRQHSHPPQPHLTKSGKEERSLKAPAMAKRSSTDPTASHGDAEVSASFKSQQQLNEYREKLARDLERREMSARGMVSGQDNERNRPSPIQEETLSNSPLVSSGLTTASTESGNTIRGGMTPAVTAGTPSYPFPRMAHNYHHYPYTPSALHRPFTTLSPTPDQASGYSRAQDKILSGNSTPASNFTFQPHGASSYPESFDFPTPNLYDLSLMLSAEPGLDSWWSTVVQIMRDVYRAERVTLSVPADPTDLENVPWGQKATYNEHQEDDLSLAYLTRGSNRTKNDEHESPETASREAPSSPKTAARPGIYSRHSYTSFEDRRADSNEFAATKRPSYLGRSKSYLPPEDQLETKDTPPPLNKSTLQEHDAQEEPEVSSWEVPLQARSKTRGRMLPVLQALDYEADPLIDHSGVMRVLERGTTVTLTRSYPYLAPQTTTEPASQSSTSKPALAETSKKPKKQRSEGGSNLSNVLSSSGGARARKTLSSDKNRLFGSRLEDDEPRPSTPSYEEFEQAPPSPWSQSPAPSPAVRTDTKENPFFTDATVDEDSFNPDSAPEDYSTMQPPEAIGVDNSWTVMHIPLSHVLQSKMSHVFRLDPTALAQRTSKEESDSRYNAGMSPEAFKQPKPAPIAILSILSPLIPYPSSLRHSLDNLAPHMATSFSLCRHHTNLETELAGIHRRRPPTTGFGALASDGRPIATGMGVNNDDMLRQQSLAGSLTSPSDYSGVSKSITNSPAGTPGWDHGSMSYILEKRSVASPGPLAPSGEGYFSSKQRSLGSGLSSRPDSKDASPSDKKLSRPASSRAAQETFGSGENVKRNVPNQDSSSSLSFRSPPVAEAPDPLAASFPTPTPGEGPTIKAQHEHAGHHTKLHSYGADFAATFQSLTPSSTVGPRPPMLPSRVGSFAPVMADLPPPSDKLKGLILDSLPAQIFVALPKSGEIVWVNSQFLIFRGQSAQDLAEDPWGSLHPEDRENYLQAWSHSLRTGEAFSAEVRIRRFDGKYRYFQAKAVASKDKHGVIVQFLGSYTDVHDRVMIAKKMRQQAEQEATEASYKLLADLIPQIIFKATEADGIVLSNEQWLSYTGQGEADAQGLGFMDFVHPEDLARCRIPLKSAASRHNTDHENSPSSDTTPVNTGPKTDAAIRSTHRMLSRENSSSGDSLNELASAELTELARKGVIKIGTDSSGRLTYTTEVRLRSKSGEYRWHLIRCVETDSIDGGSEYFGSATDINDHKLLETKLKEAMESKSRFLSNMSHEIRTPLIGISGMVTFLQDTTLDDEQLDYTNTIQTSANSLIMIINDILDLSKVDAGMMKLNYEWFHARSIIEDVNELVSTMAIAKRLELNYLVEADVPAWVKGDKVRIRQVLLNVIGNAIKFTTEGEVFSHCKVVHTTNESTDEHELLLEFSVTDTGRGFSKEEAERIFKPFSQIDTSSTRQHGGSGLGLVISKQLVELHGGHMEGTAVLGQGSTFTFSAKFGLPTADDHPDVPGSPNSTMYSAASRQQSTESVPGSIKPLPPAQRLQNAEVSPRGTEQTYGSPDVPSTGSSDPSVHSGRSNTTGRSSSSSVTTGLARFSEAAKASGQDLTKMKLEMPSGKVSPSRTATPGHPGQISPDDFRPPMYSILVICPQLHSREATTQHIEMTLPKEVPHQITALASVEEAQKFIGGADPIKFTHIVINLPSPKAIVDLLAQIASNQRLDKTTVLILSDSVQRQDVMKLATDSKFETYLSEGLVNFIYKPVKPSRFAVIFDPNRERDESIDRNKSTAQKIVDAQKASYEQIQRLVANKNYQVLLVEDNPVNQKVLLKYLQKVGLDVDIASDGVECTDKVLSKPHKHYALILCDLHMPRKDGYQTCREIRHWERVARHPEMPIIALSADVLADVQHKCVAAGFSDYVSKPVDFIELGKAVMHAFDPTAPPRRRS